MSLGVTTRHITQVLCRKWVYWLNFQATLQPLVSEKQYKGAWASMVLSVRWDELIYNSTPSNSKLWEGWVLVACNECVRLQSKVTSSGAAVNSWVVLFHFILLLFVCLVLFCSRLLFLLIVCKACLFVLCCCHCFSFNSFSFVSMWMRRGYNHLLVRKLTFSNFLELYINFECGGVVAL